MASHCPGSFIIYPNETVSQCDYCGSLSVDDTINFLKQSGTQFSGSDWKYGWPHKFYIEPINPEADKVVQMGSRTSDGTGPDDYWSCWAHGNHLDGNTCTCPKDTKTGCWHEPIMGTRKYLHYKFYNTHLSQATDEQVKIFGDLSLKIFGIFWGRDDKGIFYRAPKTNSFYGYQRAGIIKADGLWEHKL